jgi:hypothetical protein
LKLVGNVGESLAFDVAVTDESGSDVDLAGGYSAEFRVNGTFSKTFSSLSGASISVELTPAESATIPSGFHSFIVDLSEPDGSSWAVSRGELHMLPSIAGD